MIEISDRSKYLNIYGFARESKARESNRARSAREESQTYTFISVDMFVSQSWVEPRLDMPQDIFEEDDDYVILPPEFFDNLWQPDPYFLNSKVSGEYLPANNATSGPLSNENYSQRIFSEIATLNHKFSLVTLYRNKTVKYSARINAIVACQMEFQLYPMDIQICPIYIESCK